MAPCGLLGTGGAEELMHKGALSRNGANRQEKGFYKIQVGTQMSQCNNSIISVDLGFMMILKLIGRKEVTCISLMK